MDPTTATTVLLVLGSAFGVMFATMTTLLVVSIRVQHRESIAFRTEIGQQIVQAFEKLGVEFTERLDSRFAELMTVIERNHEISELQHKATQKRLDRLEAGFADLSDRLARISDRLSGVSDRLARVEGHLGIGLHPQAPAASDESDSDAA